MANFEASHAINDYVTFTPMYKHQKQYCVAEEELDGEVKSVRFTEAKVFYDVYSPYWGILFDGVASDRVVKPSEMVMQQEPTTEPTA